MPIAAVNGIDLYHEDRGSGPALVLIHRANSSARQWTGHIADLSQDFRVIAPDLRGYGRSSHGPDAAPPAWVADLAALLGHLGVAQAHIVGSTFGSRVALRFAIDHPELTTSLTLDAPILAPVPGNSERFAQRLNPGTMSDEAKEAHRAIHGDDWAEVITNYVRLREAPEFTGPFDMREAAASLPVPTLIMRGDADDVVHPLAHAVEAFERMPDARLAILPKSAVTVANDQPEVFRRLIREFVADLAPVAAG